MRNLSAEYYYNLFCVINFITEGKFVIEIIKSILLYTYIFICMYVRVCIYIYIAYLNVNCLVFLQKTASAVSLSHEFHCLK